jgi:hypothetical protein
MSAILPVLGFIFYLLPVSFPLCEDSSAFITTELVELQRIHTRLLIDYPQSRFVYIENRRPGDPVLHPDQWALGISSPLLTAGPVALSGILPQIYNPLSHGPGSDVFSETTDISLNIDLDIGSRSGVIVEAIPEHWEWFLLYKEEIGAQVGSLMAIPLGQRTEFEFLGLLSHPSDQLQDGGDESWFVDTPLFPGGLLNHLAGSFAFDLQPVSLYLSATVSAGQRVPPGAVYSLHTTWTAPRTEVFLLIGHCTERFFTPEGRRGDLQWIFATRLVWDSTPIYLFGSYRKEISRLPLFPTPFRESRDQFAAGAEVCRRITSRCHLGIQADGEMELRWSTRGLPEKELFLDCGGSLSRHLWELAVGMTGQWDSEYGWERDLRLLFTLNPSWGVVELEMGMQSRPAPGWHLAADVELKGEGKRFYARLETRQALPFSYPEQGYDGMKFLDLLSIHLGWEAETGW